MSKERELLESCLDEFQYHEVPCPELVIKIKKLLAEPEQEQAEAIMPNGVCVSNVYDAYEEGRKSVMSEQEPVAWIIETEIYGKLSEWVCTDKKHYMEAHDSIKEPIPLYTTPQPREPLTNEQKVQRQNLNKH